MNKIYRVIWNEFTRTWVAVAENVRARQKRASVVVDAGPGTHGEAFSLTPLALALVLIGSAQAAPPAPTQLPTGGQVVAGTAGIQQAGAVLNITQSSSRAAIDWQTFNVGSAATVNFVQPSAGSVTLNRVLDSNPSQIFGRISANGQVFLTNPNGVYFSPSASVDVGGLVATTHGIDNADFMAGNYRFTRHGASGRIINEGELKASLGGYIALLAPEVRNNGIIVAQLGTVALAAGEAYELQFDGNNTLAQLRVEPATIKALVDNGNAVQAPGGLIILSAQAADRLQGGVVNNTGALEASGLVEHGGTIRLEASDLIGHSGSLRADAAPASAGHGGSVTLIASLANPESSTELTGSISARGGDLGGDGGFVETSAGRVRIGDSSHIDTRAPRGKSGTWLIDPVDFTIASGSASQTSSGIGAATLASNLGSSNVSIATDSSTAGNGDIFVNAAVSWSANTLTLSAHRSININAGLNGSGSASLALEYGQGAVAAGNTSSYNVNAAVNLPAGNNFSTKLGSDGTVRSYTVITSLGSAGSTTSTDLQGINGNLAGNYVLGANIDASATSAWNSGAGFQPIGNSTTNFTGIFDGLGHVVSGLRISRAQNYVGMFGITGTASRIQNAGLLTATIVGSGNAYYVGALAGQNKGSISNAYADASVQGATHVGGLVGNNQGSIRSSYSLGSVRGGNRLGGLVGVSEGGGASISYSYSSAAVSNTVSQNIYGGLVGENSGTIGYSYATSRLTVPNNATGGLVGRNYGTVSNSYWNSSIYATGIGAATTTGATGLTTAQMQTAANFSSFNFTTTPGAAGNNWVMVNTTGGLNSGSGATYPMLASEYSTTINNVHQLQLMAMDRAASYTLARDIAGAATGAATDVWNRGTFIPVSSYNDAFTGSLDGQGHTISSLTLSNLHNLDSLWDWNVGLFGYIGAGSTVQNLGLVGGSVAASGNAGGLAGTNDGIIRNSYNTGTVSGSNNVGGLVGLNAGTISSSYATGAITLTGGIDAGGLVGSNYQHGSISDSYATGAVTGVSYVGGLVGRQEISSFATIRNSYAIGVVSGTSHVGGLLGGNNDNSVTDSFFSAENNPSLPGIASGNTTTGATGKTNAELKTRTTYPSGWDFTSANNEVWNISASVNNGYPFLCGISGGCVVQVGSTPIYLRLISGSSIYGDLPNLTYALYTTSTGGTLVSDANQSGTASWSTPLSATTGAGTYSESYSSGITLGNSTYTLGAGAAVNWIITPRPLNLSVSKSYDGNPNFSAGFVLAGMVNGDSTPTVNGTAAVVSGNAATYSSFSSSTLSPSNGNYTLTGGTVAATIAKAPLTVTADNAAKTYGEANPALSTTLSGFVNDEILATAGVTGTGSATTTAGVATGAGTATITAGVGSLAAANYDFTNLVNGTLSIAKAHLTVTADNAAKIFDGVPFAGGNGVHYGGFVNGETGSVLGGMLSFLGSSQGAASTGSYAIRPAGLTSSNYAITYIDGILTINPAAPPLVQPLPVAMPSTTSNPPPLTLSPVNPPAIQPAPGSPSITGSESTASQPATGSIGSAPVRAVTVSQIREPSVQQSGAFAVSVPKGTATAGTGFSFPLPAPLADLTASGAPMNITLLDNSPLPTWLRYMPETKTFVVSAVPDRAFPVEMAITVGNTRTTMVISERAGE